jgi:hypothetical protein
MGAAGVQSLSLATIKFSRQEWCQNVCRKADTHSIIDTTSLLLNKRAYPAGDTNLPTAAVPTLQSNVAAALSNAGTWASLPLATTHSLARKWCETVCRLVDSTSWKGSNFLLINRSAVLAGNTDLPTAAAPTLQYNVARCAEQGGDLGIAASGYNRVLQQCPNYVECLIRLGYMALVWPLTVFLV